ncbi:MAG: carboxypeptidase-like regulatory domain-containing protein, partial [Balneolaceae bacterium]|nr:carboxypeptidase-like regulatory domain-containing protein [Balneolaceae bacterium]
MKRHFCLLTLFLLIVNPAFSQTDIEGTVYDAQSGETLPSATVLLEGTYRGTITNTEGHFSITVDELPATLQIRYIGYESARIEISQETSLPIDIELNVSVTELGEIVVTEEDPGLSIMERVIARKQIWRENLDTYQAEAYTRQILSNDTSIVSITESSSIVYWDSEEGHREIQVSRRQTSNMSEDQNFAGVNYQPNFYDDNVEIAGYRIVGIT